MIVGGIDLAVPAVIGMGDVVATQLYGQSHRPSGVVVLILVALCVIIGVVNALSSVFLGVHSLIITLAMGLVITGGVLTWTHGNVNGNVPNWVHTSVSVIAKTGPIPLPVVCGRLDRGRDSGDRLPASDADRQGDLHGRLERHPQRVWPEYV